MRKMFWIFVFSVFSLFLNIGTAGAQEFFDPETFEAGQQTIQGPTEGVICTDPNDLDTCYSDPNYDLNELLQEESGDSGGAQNAGNAPVQASFKLKELAADLNPMDISDPEDLFSIAINALMAFIGSVALLLYIFAGFLWMSAGGNADKISKAKTIMIWTTLGAVAMGASYMIVRVVLERVG